MLHLYKKLISNDYYVECRINEKQESLKENHFYPPPLRTVDLH